MEEKALLKTSNPAAHEAEGKNGKAHSAKLQGRWVKTIEFSNPIRFTTAGAKRKERAAITLQPKKTGPRKVAST